jgi:hypothetical protein
MRRKIVFAYDGVPLKKLATLKFFQSRSNESILSTTWSDNILQLIPISIKNMSGTENYVCSV